MPPVALSATETVASILWSNSPTTTSSLTLSQPLTGWQAQLILTIPFYDGGFRYGAAHERRVLTEEARINVEPRSLWWIWTHRLVDFLRLKLWM